MKALEFSKFILVNIIYNIVYVSQVGRNDTRERVLACNLSHPLGPCQLYNFKGHDSRQERKQKERF